MTELPDPPQPLVDAIDAALVADSRPDYDGLGINASECGTECARALFYTLCWASPSERTNGRRERIFERGEWEEDRVLRYLRMAGCDVLALDPRTEQQWRFSLARGLLRGRADGKVEGIPEAPKTVHVLEIKSLKASDWRAIRKHGLAKAKPLHWHQLQAGMVGLGHDRGLYIGVNKDTEEILTERLHLDAERMARIAAKVEALADAYEAPSRIADDPASYACRFCRHKGVCHEGQMARRTCRSCLHFTFGEGGQGHCGRFARPLSHTAQRAGCPVHLYLPTLVPGEQTDADPEGETVTYLMPDGSTWVDGAPGETAA